MEGFRSQLDAINALADRTPGFVWRLQTDEGNATSIRPYADDRMAINMSVWEAMDALQGYVYQSAHVGPLRDRKKWFEPIEGPILALWWIPAGTIPTIADAVERLQVLKERGPSRDAFTFKAPFPAPEENIRIVPTDERFVEGFAAVLDFVAREHRYIGFVEGPPVEGTRQFVKSIIAGAGVQMMVVDGDTVVGWCDIMRNPIEGFRHVGRLGMGLMPGYRGRGLGRRLAVETIRAARAAGMERVELEVFATNERAIALYKSIGFVIEGVRQRSRKLDGDYDDNVCMALLDQIA